MTTVMLSTPFTTKPNSKYAEALNPLLFNHDGSRNTVVGVAVGAVGSTDQLWEIAVDGTFTMILGFTNVVAVPLVTFTVN